MDLCGSKKSPIWLWWAVNRATQGVVGWVLGDRDACAARALGSQIPRCASITYATDQYSPYIKLFANDNHIIGKAHTHQIESANSRLRGYLARLRRKGHCYTKSISNLCDSLLFVFHRRMNCPLTKQTGTVVCSRVFDADVSIPI